jgi:hypothetical protein
MGKIISTRISKFDGGMAQDIREPITDKFSLTRHFEVFSDPYKLSPKRDMEADNTIAADADAMKAYDVNNFLLGSNKYLYALGIKPTTTLPEIFYKDDPIDGLWTAPASAEASAGVKIDGCFIEYKNYLWGFHKASNPTDPSLIFKYGDITSSPTFTNSVSAVSVLITSVAQGVIGPDDLLYLAYNNIICRISAAGALTDTVLTLPTKYRITSLCIWGNFLCIACCEKNAESIGEMKVYLWDRDSSLVTITDVVSFGEGNDLKIAIVDGYLVGVIKRYPNSMIFANAGATIVKVVDGSVAKTKFQRRETSTGTLTYPIVKDNRLYFINNAGVGTTTGEGTNGLWCVYRKQDGTWAVTCDTIYEDAATTTLVAFGNFADYWFLVDTDGNIKKTNDTASYTFSSVYESLVFDGKIHDYDSSYTKKLLGVSAMTEKLPTAGQVVLKYRTDGSTTWVTIFTNTTDDSISYEATKTAGDNLPQYKEIEFRIESTGGAVITGFSFAEEIIDERLY